jgi:ATP-dependent helicase/nuclease subunit B
LAALKFLAIVGEAWPRVLAGVARSTPSNNAPGDRAQAARGARAAATPVIAAGSTGSQPPRDLLAAIAQLPQGAVVLPGLDRDMDEASWGARSIALFGLRELLAALDCERSDVAAGRAAVARRGIC